MSRALYPTRRTPGRTHKPRRRRPFGCGGDAATSRNLEWSRQMTNKRARPSPPEAPDTRPRCGWSYSGMSPDYIRYHDEEWGVPVHDDRLLFEFLILEGAQAGLSAGRRYSTSARAIAKPSPPSMPARSRVSTGARSSGCCSSRASSATGSRSNRRSSTRADSSRYRRNSAASRTTAGSSSAASRS